MSSKPTVLIVGGAWHLPLHYMNLHQTLQAKGYPVRIPSLATSGRQESLVGKNVKDDVAIITAVLREEFEKGNEVVVACHSFGGISSTDSVVGQSIQERHAKGAAGGIKAIVYIAAFAPPTPGLSLMNLVGIKDEDQTPGWWSKKDELAVLDSSACRLLYNDVDQEVARICFDSTSPQSWASFQQGCSHGTGEVTVAKKYLVTLDDAIIPVEGQRAMAAAARADVVELRSGHSPFLKPGDLPIIVQVIEDVVSI